MNAPLPPCQPRTNCGPCVTRQWEASRKPTTMWSWSCQLSRPSSVTLSRTPSFDVHLPQEAARALYLGVPAASPMRALEGQSSETLEICQLQVPARHLGAGHLALEEATCCGTRWVPRAPAGVAVHEPAGWPPQSPQLGAWDWGSEWLPRPRWRVLVGSLPAPSWAAAL